MGENQVFPDWLDIDTGMLAEEISDIEVDLLHNSEKYRSLHKEKFKLLNAYPKNINGREAAPNGTASLFVISPLHTLRGFAGCFLCK